MMTATFRSSSVKVCSSSTVVLLWTCFCRFASAQQYGYDNNNKYYYSDSSSFGGSTGYGSNSYTTTTEQSWFDRMGESFMSLVFGIILCFVAPYLLFWNEGRSVRRQKQIKFVSKETQSNVTYANQPSNEGRLIHVTGLAKPKTSFESGQSQPLQDPTFGIPPKSALETCQDLIVLKRNVQMMQWVESSRSETEKTAGGGTRTNTTYSYDKEWQSYPVNSESFNQRQYHNPPMEFQSETFWNEGGVELQIDGTKQVFGMSEQLHHMIPTNEQYDTNRHGGGVAPTMNFDFGGGGGYGSMGGGGFSSWISSTTFQFGPNPPDIGTHRVNWDFSGPQTVSIIAKQYNGGLTEWTSQPGQAGQPQCFSICRLTTGERSLEQMIEMMHTENKVLTWFARIVGTFLWGLAIQMTFKPLEVIFDLGTIPFLGFEPGTIIAWLTGAVAYLIGFILSLVVIAIAWLFYRPLLGITLLAIAVGLIFTLSKLGNPATSTAAPTAAPTMAVATSVASVSCPGGSILACTDSCKELADQAYRICVESCVSKCA